LKNSNNYIRKLTLSCLVKIERFPWRVKHIYFLKTRRLRCGLITAEHVVHEEAILDCLVSSATILCFAKMVPNVLWS